MLANMASESCGLGPDAGRIGEEPAGPTPPMPAREGSEATERAGQKEPALADGRAPGGGTLACQEMVVSQPTEAALVAVCPGGA